MQRVGVFVSIGLIKFSPLRNCCFSFYSCVPDEPLVFIPLSALFFSQLERARRQPLCSSSTLSLAGWGCREDCLQTAAWHDQGESVTHAMHCNTPGNYRRVLAWLGDILLWIKRHASKCQNKDVVFGVMGKTWTVCFKTNEITEIVKMSKCEWWNVN